MSIRVCALVGAACVLVAQPGAGREEVRSRCKRQRDQGRADYSLQRTGVGFQRARQD